MLYCLLLKKKKKKSIKFSHEIRFPPFVEWRFNVALYIAHETNLEAKFNKVQPDLISADLPYFYLPQTFKAKGMSQVFVNAQRNS